MEKPYNLKQLRAIIRLLLPLAVAAAKKREESIFLSMKEYNEKETGEDSFNLKRVMLDELTLIKTVPGNKNNVLLQLKNDKRYLSHTSLKDIGKVLPRHFIRFSGDKIINAKLIDGKGKSAWVYYIGKERFEIADVYRTDELRATLHKLHL
jgi:hypothetical protein